MLHIPSPAPMRIWDSSAVAKSEAKKKTNAPTPMIATLKRNNDLCLNLMLKALMTKPMMRNRKLETAASWLAVPIGTLSDDAISTRSVLRRTIPVNPRNEARINVGSSKCPLRLLSN